MIDIEKMPLQAILGWLDAPKDQGHENILHFILKELKRNIESEFKEKNGAVSKVLHRYRIDKLTWDDSTESFMLEYLDRQEHRVYATYIEYEDLVKFIEGEEDVHG